MLIVECSPLITPPHILSRLADASRSKLACWVNYSIGRENFEEYLQITNGRVVKVERLQEQNLLCQVDDMGRLNSVCSSLAERMKWNSRSSGSGELPALMLSKRKFEQVLSHSDDLGMEEIMAELLGSYDDKAGVVALARCLKMKRCQGNITFYNAKKNKWEGQSAQFINDHYMSWLIRSSTKDDEDWLIATPMPKEKFQDMMITWFRQSQRSEALPSGQSVS